MGYKNDETVFEVRFFLARRMNTPKTVRSAKIPSVTPVNSKSSLNGTVKIMIDAIAKITNKANLGAPFLDS